MPKLERLLHLRMRPDEVPERVVLTGDPGRVDRIAGLLDGPKVLAHNREFRSVKGEYGGAEVLICSTGIGGPSTAIAVNELLEAGAELLIRVGTTGALQKGIEIGSLVVPHGALRMDGASEFYAPAEYPAVPDPRLALALTREARLEGLTVHEGIIATLDAFYVDKEWLVEQASELNLLSVEMECSTIFVLSRLSGARSAAVLVVDGNIAEGTGKAEVRSPASELPEESQDALMRAAEVALRVLSSE